MPSKTCFKCLQVKPLEAFYRHPMMADGRLNKCIDCTKTDAKRNRADRIDYYKEYDRNRGNNPGRVAARKAYAKTEGYKASHAASLSRWLSKHSDRRRAQIAVGNAIRDGRLAPEPCFVCGDRAQAHHADYSAPLAVTWLCAKHHAQAHKEHRELVRSQQRQAVPHNQEQS